VVPRGFVREIEVRGGEYVLYNIVYASWWDGYMLFDNCFNSFL
jgi:hypothetical protein